MTNDRISLYNARRDLDIERAKRKKRELAKVRPEFRAKVMAEGECRRCGHRGVMEAHHIVHRSILRGKGSIVRDHVDNAMALCRDCHGGYHSGKVKFHRSMLSESELAFIMEHTSERWLEKRYSETDERRSLRNRRGRNPAPRDSRRAAEAASRLDWERRDKKQGEASPQEGQEGRGDEPGS